MSLTFIEYNLLLQRGRRLDRPLLVGFQANQVRREFLGLVVEGAELAVNLGQPATQLCRLVSAGQERADPTEHDDA